LAFLTSHRVVEQNQLILVLAQIFPLDSFVTLVGAVNQVTILPQGSDINTFGKMPLDRYF
jgi:hypothetical protein